MKFRLLVLLTGFFCANAACQATLYDLPDPPSSEKRSSVSLIPGEEERRKREVYLEARARILEIYKLLSTQRYEEVVEDLSLETRDFLLSMGGGSTVAEVLASGKLETGSGELVDFMPVSMLLAEDLSQLHDSIDGIEEHETSNRKEIFATLPSGKLQKIVLIQEGGKWLLHRTRIPEPFHPPAK